MKFDFIIAHHNENKYRERNLNEIIKYYLEIIPEDSNIIIVEQNTESAIEFNDNRIIHVKEKYSTEYFWKSKLLNKGVSISDKEAFCVVDSDAVITKEAVDHISTLDSETFNMLFPYTKVKMMNEGETRVWIRSRKIPSRIDKSYQKFSMCYTGFFMVMSKNNYELIGGFDEEYIGWGGEDDAMVIKTNRLANVSEMPFESLVMHLYHPRKDNSEYLKTTRFKTNEIYTYALKIMPMSVLKNYCQGAITLADYKKMRKLDENSRIKRINLKNGNFSDIAITGVYPLPDDEEGNFSDFTLFKGLFVLLGEETFKINIDRLIEASSDEEEKQSIRDLVENTISFFSKDSTQ